MPTEGQQVYGAQHPPSLKLIKELQSSSNVSSSTPGSLSSNPSSQQHKSSAKAFKNFEKNTYDVWDIEDSDSNLDEYAFPISIADSEEMAKKIIKNHQESVEKANETKTNSSPKHSNDKSLSKSNMGPGKALRQQNASNYDEENSNTIDRQLGAGSSEMKKNLLVTSLKTSSLQTVSSSSTTTTTSQQFNSSPDSFDNRKDQLKSSKHSFLASNNQEEQKCIKFNQILNHNPVNLEDLQKASWKGIPKIYRPVCWKLLSEYLPLKLELQEKTIEQKRNAYWELVNEFYKASYLESHHDMLRQILNDIPRMNPLISIFQKDIVQNIFQRVLYVWAVRHPASGYVQGINDLLTPFFVVFLTEYCDTSTEIQNVEIENLGEKELRQVEADSYWCMTHLLDKIQENFVFSQPGIQKRIQSLEDLIKRIDNNLYAHLTKNGIQFIQFAFRWMNNLLMREIPLKCTIRLWDTYHAEPFGFSDFHLYVCGAFLARFSKQLMEEKDFQGLMLLIQNLPTKNWKASDIDLLTAEAYLLQAMFANSPNHMAKN